MFPLFKISYMLSELYRLTESNRYNYLNKLSAYKLVRKT